MPRSVKSKPKAEPKENLARILDALRTFIDRSLTASGGQPCVHDDDFWELKREFDAVMKRS